MSATLPELHLSEDQQVGRTAIVDGVAEGRRVLSLVGPAGSGKTTMTRIILNDLEAVGWSVQGGAPTGRAALRMMEAAGYPATTLHKLLFQRVQTGRDGRPKFFDPKAPCDRHEVLWIDEASMVDRKMHAKLLEFIPSDSILLYTGDTEQIPPISGHYAPPLDHPDAVLTQVHRQALDEPIIAIATDVRNGIRLPMEDRIKTREDGEVVGYFRRRGSVQSVADWIVSSAERGDDCAALCWRNKTRHGLNRLVRRLLGHDGKDLVIGEKLLILGNNHTQGWMNGEVGTIQYIMPMKETGWYAYARDRGIRVSEEELGAVQVGFTDGRSAMIQPSLIGVDPGEFRKRLPGIARTAPTNAYLHVDYGYGMTVHKAQGSEYDSVAVILDGWAKKMAVSQPVQTRKMIYTAITRSKMRVGVFDVG